MLHVKRDFLKETVYIFLSQTHKRRLTNQRDAFFLNWKRTKKPACPQHALPWSSYVIHAFTRQQMKKIPEHNHSEKNLANFKNKYKQEIKQHWTEK